MTIRGILYRILFRDIKTGYGKYVILSNPETMETYVVTGNLPELPLKTPLLIDCDKEGEDYLISSFSFKEDNPFEQIDFLSSFTDKRGKASEFVKNADRKVFSFIASHPPLFGDDIIIGEKIEQLLWLRECLLTFPDIPYLFFEKIKNNKKLRQTLTSQIYHIGIREGLSLTQCDSYWKHFGSAWNEARIQGAYRFTMSLFDKAGHTYINYKSFFLKLQKILKTDIFSEELPILYLFSKMPVWCACEENREEDKARNGNYIVYDKEIYQAEKSAAGDLLRLSIKTKENFKERYIQEIEKEEGLSFSEEQKQAIRTILKTKGVKILYGGPGTGKTLTIKGIINIYKKIHPNGVVKLCAPTGRAAQRMEESTGYESGTNHHLLEFQPFLDSMTYKDRNNPLDVDFLIMDEVSMCDIRIFSMMLAAIQDATVLLVGDPNQLPSVGAGKVLNDLISLPALFDVCHLKKVFRQAENSNIIKNSSMIIRGDSHYYEGDDFHLVKASGDEEIPDLVLNVLNSNEGAQILCPIKKGVAGVNQLNLLIQKKINGEEKKYRKYGKRILKLDDKVILTRNCPEYHYYNGDMGYIREIDSYGIYIQCEKRMLYVPNEFLHDVDLAYAVTVHKSQGSEYPTVIIILPQSNFPYRNLLYTAVTRAKEKVIVIESPNGWDNAVYKQSPIRNSRLIDCILERSKLLCQTVS